MSEIKWDGVNILVASEWFKENVPGCSAAYVGFNNTLVVQGAERDLHIPRGALLRYDGGQTFDMILPEAPRTPVVREHK